MAEISADGGALGRAVTSAGPVLVDAFYGTLKAAGEMLNQSRQPAEQAPEPAETGLQQGAEAAAEDVAGQAGEIEDDEAWLDGIVAGGQNTILDETGLGPNFGSR